MHLQGYSPYRLNSYPESHDAPPQQLAFYTHTSIQYLRFLFLHGGIHGNRSKQPTSARSPMVFLKVFADLNNLFKRKTNNHLIRNRSNKAIAKKNTNNHSQNHAIHAYCIKLVINKPSNEQEELLQHK